MKSRQVLGADERQLPGLLRSVQPGPLICAALAALQAARAEGVGSACLEP